MQQDKAIAKVYQFFTMFGHGKNNPEASFSVHAFK